MGRGVGRKRTHLWLEDGWDLVVLGAGYEYFASWNFKHLVKVGTRREVNLVNALEGYEQIEIIVPPEL